MSGRLGRRIIYEKGISMAFAIFDIWGDMLVNIAFIGVQLRVAGGNAKKSLSFQCIENQITYQLLA